MYLHYKHADLAAKNVMLKCIFIIFLSQSEILLYKGLLFGVKGSKSNKNGHLSYIELNLLDLGSIWNSNYSSIEKIMCLQWKIQQILVYYTST